MITKLVALFIVSNALAVFGRDPLPAATYTQVLDQVSIPGRITGIVEGDTIKVRILAKPEIKVRIAFIDAPEKGQAFDQRAKQAMSELVFGKMSYCSHTRLIVPGAWSPGYLSTATTRALSYLSKVFAGSTKKISVKRLR